MHIKLSKLQLGWCCLSIVILLWCGIKNSAAATLSPVGVWKTVDDNTHEPRSLVLLWQQQGKISGKILKLYFKAGESAKDICKACQGTAFNKPILGMTILWDMTEANHVWTGGKILDPQTGEIYHGKLTLSPDGQRLTVRGYIGIPLIGRTQIWFRQANFPTKQS